MPPQSQVASQNKAEKAEVPVSVLTSHTIRFSVPLRAPFTRLNVFPGDDLGALVPEEGYPELHALLSRLWPGQCDIDHIGLARKRRDLEFNLQLEASAKPNGALKRVEAALTECGNFKPIFRSGI